MEHLCASKVEASAVKENQTALTSVPEELVCCKELGSNPQKTHWLAFANHDVSA